MSQTEIKTLLSGKTSGVKVLVTGATGLIGSCAVSHLMNSGFDVPAVSRSGRGASGISLDVHDYDSVSKFMKRERPEYLLHLAWNVNPGFYFASDNLNWVISSLNLLKIFAENGGKRAVFAGTCCEYDMSYGFLQEDITPMKPDSLYGTAKLSLYELASSWSAQMNLSFAWGRIFFLYGKHERKERIVPYIIDSFLRGEKPALKYPFILRDYTYSSDIAAGMTALLMSDFNGAVNISSGKMISLHEIAEKAALLIGCPVPEYEEVYDENMPPVVVGDTRRLNHVIGFNPSVSWEEGLSDVIEERRKIYASELH